VESAIARLGSAADIGAVGGKVVRSQVKGGLYQCRPRGDYPANCIRRIWVRRRG
jgi:hypothetical protein